MNYRNVVRVMLVTTALPFLFRCNGAAAQTPQKIPLLIDSVVDDLGADWPMYCGVPFPRETLTDAETVCVVDENGVAVPTQARVMAYWPGTDYARWLGVEFIGNPAAQYFLEYGDGVSRFQDSERPTVALQRMPDSYVVTTGPAKFTLPFSGPLISHAWLDRNNDGLFADDELLIRNQSGDDLYVVDNQGRTALIGHDAADDQVRAEPEMLSSEGAPLHAAIRREGWYVTETGERVARHITRLHFYAGQASVRIEHTFIFTEDTDELWFQDVGLRFRHNLENVRQLAFDNSSDFDAQSTVVELRQDDKAVYMFQEKATQFSRRDQDADQRFVIARVRLNGETEIIEVGNRCGEWAAAGNTNGGVAVAVRDFWQQFPKEIEVTSNDITVHLWSNRGGRDLDVRLQTLREKWPTEWLATESASYQAMERRPASALGVAKTHELLLSLHPGNPAQTGVVRTAHTLNRPVYCTVDPWWLYHSDAMGPIYPRDETRFPLGEGFMETFFDQNMAVIRSWGDHGFFDYGSGPHVWYRIPNDGPMKGTWVAYTDRYSGQIDYGFHSHLWRMYARSGQRKYLEYAEETNRHRMDICMVHWDSPKAYDPIIGAYMHGKYKGGFSAGNTQVYWSPYTTLHHQSGTDLRKLYWYYYLRDYRRAHDVTEQYRALVKKVWQHSKGPFTGTRPFPTLKCLATLYQETGDPEILAIGRERLAALVDLDSPQGVTPDLPTKLGKYGPKIGAVERWYEATGDELAAKALLRGAETYARTSMGNIPFTYYNCMARVLTRAWEISRDPLYPRILERNMQLAIANYHDPVNGAWRDMIGNIYSASTNVYPLGDMAIGMAAITQYGEALDTAPALQQTGRGRPVLALFEKTHDKEVLLDIRGRYPIEPRVFTIAGHAVDNVHLEPFTESLYSVLKTEHPSVFQVHIPAAEPAGTYILDAGIGGGPWEVTSTNAESIVLFAPGGISIGGGGTWKGRFHPGATPEAAPVTWYFQVPETTPQFRLFRSADIILTDPSGKQIEIDAAVPGWIDVPVTPESAGRLWSLRAVRNAFIELRGVPGIFAAGNPSRFFMPNLAAIPVQQFGMERDYTFTDGVGEPSPEELFAPGVGNGRGLVLAGGRALVLPRGEDLGDGRFEYFNTSEGTIEFWLKPYWSSVYQPQSASAYRILFSANPWSALLHYGGHRGSTFAITGEGGRLADVAAVTLERGLWTHFVYQWRADGEDYVLETFINGKLRNQENIAAARQSGFYVGRRKDWQPRPIQQSIVFGRASAAAGFLDAVIDELRISAAPRYTDNFVPQQEQPLTADATTLALFHFEDSADGVDAEGRVISGQVIK